MAKKIYTFSVQLQFEDDTIETAEQLKETAEKIADTLKHECSSGNGLAPESADTYTTSICVIPETTPEKCVQFEVKDAFGWVRSI